jgi:hypothetical protein
VSRKTTNISSIFNSKYKELIDDFLNQNPEAKQFQVEKIFPNLTTKDTVSISRQGHTVTIPPFWACFRINCADINSSMKWIRIFKSYPKIIDYAHYDYQVDPLTTPDDELYNLQTGLFDPDGIADINVEEAWEVSTGRKFIKVGVHDNGIDSIHPDIDVLTGVRLSFT